VVRVTSIISLKKTLQKPIKETGESQILDFDFRGHESIQKGMDTLIKKGVDFYKPIDR